MADGRFGRATYNAESAVNVLVDGKLALVIDAFSWLAVIQDQSGKEYKMDHVQVRFPTNVEDVGRVIYDLTRTSTPAHLYSANEQDYHPSPQFSTTRPQHRQWLNMKWLK